MMSMTDDTIFSTYTLSTCVQGHPNPGFVGSYLGLCLLKLFQAQIEGYIGMDKMY
jgi:hypothetical protein